MTRKNKSNNHYMKYAGKQFVTDNITFQDY